MNEKMRTKFSRFLSLVLRHQPSAADVVLDEQGWVETEALLAGMAKAGKQLSIDEFQEIVETNSKKRFEFSEDGAKIRASQGHSLDVDLGYKPATPPKFLYHGTVERFLDSIRETGIVKGKRHHVHLSEDIETASKVGQRRGEPVILKIAAGAMHADGMEFFVSTNGVWLVDYVSPERIDEWGHYKDLDVYHKFFEGVEHRDLLMANPDDDDWWIDGVHMGTVAWGSIGKELVRNADRLKYRELDLIFQRVEEVDESEDDYLKAGVFTGFLEAIIGRVANDLDKMWILEHMGLHALDFLMVWTKAEFFSAEVLERYRVLKAENPDADLYSAHFKT